MSYKLCTYFDLVLTTLFILAKLHWRLQSLRKAIFEDWQALFAAGVAHYWVEDAEDWAALCQTLIIWVETSTRIEAPDNARRDRLVAADVDWAAGLRVVIVLDDGHY